MLPTPKLKGYHDATPIDVRMPAPIATSGNWSHSEARKSSVPQTIDAFRYERIIVPGPSDMAFNRSNNGPTRANRPMLGAIQ